MAERVKKELSARQVEIIGAALDLISSNGIEALTIRHLSERLGFSEAAFYRHFPSKGRIFSALAERFEQSSGEFLDRIGVGGQNAPERVAAFFLDRCRLFASDRLVTEVMFSEELFKADAELAQRVRRIISGHRRQLEEILAAGQAAGSITPRVPPGHLFMVIMGALRLLVGQWRLHGRSFDLEESGRELWLSIKELITLKNDQTGGKQ